MTKEEAREAAILEAAREALKLVLASHPNGRWVDEVDEKDLAIATILFDAGYGHARREPVDMLLYCPICFEQHMDEPQPEKNWDNPPHRSHECQWCGYVWRPSDRATNGVASLQTKGKTDKSSKPVAFANGKDFDNAVQHAQRDEAEAVREFLDAVCEREHKDGLRFPDLAESARWYNALEAEFNERYGEEEGNG